MSKSIKFKPFRYEWYDPVLDVFQQIDVKRSNNSKLGEGVHLLTYHFSGSQVRLKDIKLDSNNCFNCSFAYNTNKGKSGGCYTHKGMQGLGIRSKLDSLHRRCIDVKFFDKLSFLLFLQKVREKPVDLVRFGAYGEPITLPLYVLEKLVTISKKRTGYTHQWFDPVYHKYSKYLMASTHSDAEQWIANSQGWRTFTINSDLERDSILCPASKESEIDSTCVKCGLCAGTTHKTNVNIHIKQH